MHRGLKTDSMLFESLVLKVVQRLRIRKSLTMNDLPSWEVRRILAPNRRGECPERLGGNEALPPPSYDPLRVEQPYQINSGMVCPTSHEGRS